MKQLQPETTVDKPPLRERMTPGMKTFFVIWAGHLVSVVGSALTNFGIGVYIFQRTHSTQQYSLLMLSYFLPSILLAPVTGSLVDRYNRRKALIVSEGGAALSSVMLVALILLGRLSPTGVYLLVAISSAFATISWPATSAVTTLLVPKRHYTRANSMLMFSESVAGILGPAMGGIVMHYGGLSMLVTADVISFIVAIGTLLVVRVPKVTTHAAHAQSSIGADILYGWRYVTERKGLLGLLTFFMVCNLFYTFLFVLVTPFLLTLYREDIAGQILAVQGVALVAGSVIMAIWKGFGRRSLGVLFGTCLSLIALPLILLPPNPFVLATLLFMMAVGGPIGYSHSQSIWMSKTDPAVQGRAFAIRRVLAGGLTPIATLLAGYLYEHLLGPGMKPGGVLSHAFGPIFGSGPDAGYRLAFIITGVGVAAMVAITFMNPHVRHIETELPDFVHEAAA